MANALINEFGTLPSVLSGDQLQWARLTSDRRISSFLSTLRDAISHALYAKAQEQPVLRSLNGVCDYLKFDMSWHRRERFRVLHLDARHRLIRNELASEGTTDRSSEYVREVIARALAIGSTSLILVHNHPTGDPTPSATDIQITKAIDRAARVFGIALLDHIIVAKNNMVSMRERGVI